MEKLKMHTRNFIQENIAKLAELFPNCVTEANESKIRYAIDFDLLKQELSTDLVEGPQERYHLNWPGKRAALHTANAPIAKTLRPYREESVDFDSTENLFIEGDNLDALKLLQETYLGKVKMIYIDPPYNTGKDFIYRDDFKEDSEEYLRSSGQKDDDGNKMITNSESNGRFHSDWLSMMYPRLKLARNLLRDDGVIFISIDEHEVHNLKRIGDEIFGVDNYIAQLAVQLNPRGRHLDKFIAKTHESVLIFGKNIDLSTTMFGVGKEGKMVDEYNRTDAKGPFRVLGLRNRNQAFNPETRPKLYYPLYVCPGTGKVSISKDEVFTDEVLPDTPDGIKTCWTWGKEKVVKENSLLAAEKSGEEWRVYRKDYFLDENGEPAKTLPKSLWVEKEINNDNGRKSVKELLGGSLMDFPKSIQLVQKLVKTGVDKNDIMLDFFAGSATTAHAVMQLNAEDGGNRKFIMVQLPEKCDPKSEAFKAGYKTIAEISKERIRRAGQKILEGDCHEGWNKDIGFRVLKVDSSNMEDVYYNPDQVKQDFLDQLEDNIRADRSPEDLLFQVLLDWGVGLSLPVEKKLVAGLEVFFVDNNALAACFVADGKITEDFCRTLAEFKPLRVVFRDAGFASDEVKINVEQVFRLLSPHTEVKTI